MTATVATARAARPVDGGDGGAPARRAVVRWAWRLFRREWRQQFLVLALLTASVAAMVLGAAVATNTPPPGVPGFGSADHLVTLPGKDPNLTADLASITRAFGPVDVIENASIATGIAGGAQVRAQDPHGRFGGPMLRLVSGRYPTGAGEVALAPPLARTLGLHVGDTWTGAGADQPRRVVGLVEDPQNLLDTFALVAPGQLARPDQVTVLFDASDMSLRRFTFPAGVTAQTPVLGQGFAPALVVLVVAIFGLIFVGLVAVAGFSVVAQRRMRGLGMLASLGATDRDVRRVMLANGAVVGVVATLTGAVLGLAGWIAYAPRMQDSVHHRVVWTGLPWWLVITGMVLAVVTSILAAGRPARAAARLSIVAALSGRPAPPKPVHRSAVPGLVLTAVGPLLLAFSGGWGAGGSAKNALFQLGGMLASAVGLLLLAPVCVSLLGPIARHAPIAVRLALRDLARYRARSGAALAAISFAVLIAMVVCLLATGRYADPVDYFGPNLPANELMVYPPGVGPGAAGPGSGPDSPDSGAATAGTPSGQADPGTVANGIATALGTHDVLALQSTDAFLGEKTGDGVRSYGGSLYVATPDVLRHYGIDPASVDPAALLVTARANLASVPNLQLQTAKLGPDDVTACAPPACAANPRIQVLPQLPTGTTEPNLMLTEHAVDAFHLSPTTTGWLVRTAGALTDAQINTARQTAAAAGMTIETKNASPSLDQLRNYATTAGILLALSILAMTIGLIRSETASDLRTLTATGAGSGVRRRVTAATAGALGLLGAVLGTATAYLAATALFRGQLTERMSQPPVLDLVLVLVGLPVVAMLLSWLLAGREPAVIARRPLE